MRESKIERYLHREVTKACGTTRKWVSPGRVGVPDRIVIWPSDLFTAKYSSRPNATIHFVETKATDGKLKSQQAREHKRLRALGCKVYVLNSVQLVDGYVSVQSSQGCLRD